MYNRYIPQPDGSYTRSRLPDNCEKGAPDRPEPDFPEQPRSQRHPRPGGFLQQLLPGDFDTGDLIVILLLLLMAGDSQEERSRAILTIALYFLM